MSKTGTTIVIVVLALVAIASLAILLSRAAFARGVANGKAETEGPKPLANKTTVYEVWPLRMPYMMGYRQGCRPPAPPPAPVTPPTPPTT